MALRSSSRTTTPTSGPGRGPLSDGRSRHHRRDRRSRTRRHETSAAALRLRADALFAERAQGHRESGNGPPRLDRDAGGAPRASTAAGTGILTGPAREPWTPGAGARRRDIAPGTARTLWTDRSAAYGTTAASSPTVAVPTAHGPAAHASTGHEPVSRDPAEEADTAWRERAGLAVRERLPLWLQSRCGLERGSVAALTVLLVAAAVFAVQHFWAGRTRPVRAPEVVGAAAPYGGKLAPDDRPGARSGAPAGPSSAVGAGGSVVVVDVGGKVRAPGLQRLPAGSRVEDALRAAGGLRPGTDTDGLNRARLLVDGEQIVVGASAPPPGAGSGGSGALGPGGSAAGAVPSAPIPLNTATVDQFDSLPGVGPVLARHIIDYRTAHGGFRSVDELREVNGIGDRRFADLRDLVRP
ncbi:ComEA family DNA-binding protein [Streptomyces triticiradicis]|uniref:ComEA family DNA-binding protein n=1 Tax=Streptomyces triticiradicis TaxID=2651189 RepID=A0A7J5DLT4_9ACTN|nr:ComEA family DNA-binding protein [Streptomyces triticiradicis]KAB1989659.1 ComEA family DNA-binding protein [Streptomyces triticiradicis]